jgi:hypothetical protein
MPATTLEFYLKEGVPWVNVDSRPMTLVDFTAQPGSRLIVLKICKTILQDHRQDTPCENPVCMQYRNQDFHFPCDAMGIVGNFIKNHLLEHDRIFDAVVSENSDHVKFNLEK